MDPLEFSYDSLDDIPETLTARELYTQGEDGRFSFSGVAGIRTDADVAAMEAAKRNEKKSHSETKASLAALKSAWGDLTPEETIAKLDRMEELEAASKGNIPEEELASMAERRANITVAPMKRELAKLQKERDEMEKELSGLRSADVARQRNDLLDPWLAKLGVLPQHYDDVKMYAASHFERDESGGFFTRDGLTMGDVKLTAGATVGDWLTEVLPARPGWLPPTQGGGAGGSKVPGFAGSNPWMRATWNTTEQGRVIESKGMDLAKRLASMAGVDVMAVEPAAKKDG